MAETKYGKYVISQTGLVSPHPHHTTTVWINNEMNGQLKNAQYLLCEMVCKADDLPMKVFKPHNHDFNEYLVFLGTNPDDPYDLDGVVEIWLGDEEKHVITRSSTVFVPRGLYHTPIQFKKVNRPIIMFRTGDTLKYGNLSFSSDPKWKDHPTPPESTLK